MSESILEKLSALPQLAQGSHDTIADGMCVMEAVAYLAGEPWSDHPACACPVISAFLRSWNDGLPGAELDALMRPLIPRLIGTRSTAKIERRRATMAADWLVRVHTPAWLRMAKLDVAAAALAGLPEITDFAQCQSLRPTLEAARQDAAAARGAVRGTRTAWTAFRATAWGAAEAAVMAAAWGTAEAAVKGAAWGAAWSAGWDAAVSASARAGARVALNGTRLHLQKSALALVERMIAA